MNRKINLMSTVFIYTDDYYKVYSSQQRLALHDNDSLNVYDILLLYTHMEMHACKIITRTQ